MDPEGAIDVVATANACWYLAGCVAGSPVNLLVDTGAACTLLNSRLYRALPAARRLSLESPTEYYAQQMAAQSRSMGQLT